MSFSENKELFEVLVRLENNLLHYIEILIGMKRNELKIDGDLFNI